MEWIAAGFFLSVLLAAQAILQRKARARAATIRAEVVGNLEDLFYECIYPGYACGAIRFYGWSWRQKIISGPWFILIVVSYRRDVHVNVEDIVFQRLLRLMRDRYLKDDVLVKPLFIKRRRTDGRHTSGRSGPQGEADGRSDSASLSA